MLYHFESKERLLADLVSPALDDIEEVLRGMLAEPRTESVAFGEQFVERFVDLLLMHRTVVPIIINQGATLDDVPVMHRATEMMRQIAELFRLASSSTIEKLRFGIAFGGVAYTLASAERLGLSGEIPTDELRSALLSILHDLLVPAAPQAR